MPKKPTGAPPHGAKERESKRQANAAKSMAEKAQREAKKVVSAQKIVELNAERAGATSQPTGSKQKNERAKVHEHDQFDESASHFPRQKRPKPEQAVWRPEDLRGEKHWRHTDTTSANTELHATVPNRNAHPPVQQNPKTHRKSKHHHASAQGHDDGTV